MPYRGTPNGGGAGQPATLPGVDGDGERCCFDDWVDHSVRRARRRGTAAAITATLLEALDEAGLDGRTVLELGCGVGDLSIEAILHGALGAVGYDLSPKAIAQAVAGGVPPAVQLRAISAFTFMRSGWRSRLVSKETTWLSAASEAGKRPWKISNSVAVQPVPMLAMRRAPVVVSEQVIKASGRE